MYSDIKSVVCHHQLDFNLDFNSEEFILFLSSDCSLFHLIKLNRIN